MLSDLPTILKGIVIALTLIRVPLLLSRLLPKGVLRSACFSLRPDPRIESKSVAEVADLCLLEVLLLPVLLAEMVLLELTVYRYPHHLAGIVFNVDLQGAWTEVNTRFWALLADIPFVCLCVAVAPWVWRSWSLRKLLFKGTLTSARVAMELVTAAMDLGAVIGLAFVYVSIVRIPLFLALYRKYSIQGHHSPFHDATFEAFIQLPLDFLAFPLFLPLLLVPWHIPAAYKAVATANSPGNQRKASVSLLFEGACEWGHGIILGICVVVTPWLVLSSGNFMKLREMNRFEKVRFIASISLAEIPNLICYLVAFCSLVHAKKATFAFFLPIKGEKAAEMEVYLHKRYTALAYFASTGAGFALSLLLQSLIILTCWRIPTLFHVFTHFTHVLPEFKERLGVRKDISARKDANSLLYRSKWVEYFFAGSLILFSEWVKDLFYIPFVLLTPPWRLAVWIREVYTVPFSLAQQKVHRRALLWSSRTGCLDVVSAFASVVLVLSLWRLPFFVKLLRRNAHLGYRKTTEAKEYLSYHYCVLVSIREWGKDLLFLPICVLLTVISPWRIPQIVTILTGSAERIPTIKTYKSISSQRLQLLRMVVSVLFFDYPALVMAILLIGTVWRAMYTINVIKIHAGKYIHGIQEEADSTLFREISGQFLQLFIDLVTLLVALTVLILGVRTRHISRRIKRYSLLHKERKGPQYLLILKSWFCSSSPIKGKAGLCSLSRNSLWEICSMLELPDIGKLQCVCGYLARAIDYKPIWKHQYLNHYSDYVEKPTFKKVVQEFDYKSLAVEAYREYQKRDQILSEEGRDYRLGVRAVVLEEAVLTVLSLPDLLLLPGKCVAFLLYFLPFERYARSQSLFLRSNFEGGIYINPFVTFGNMASGVLRYDPGLRLSLSQVHHNLAMQLTWILLFCLELTTWITVYFDLLVIKLLCGWKYYSPLNQAISGVRLRKPVGLVVLQGLQIGWMGAQGVGKTALLLMPAGMCWRLTDYSLIGCVAGPWCLHLLWYALLYSNISTLLHLQGHFPYYSPWTSLCLCLNGLVNAGLTAFNCYIGCINNIRFYLEICLQRVYFHLKAICECLVRLLLNLISLASKNLTELLRLLIKVIAILDTTTFQRQLPQKIQRSPPLGRDHIPSFRPSGQPAVFRSDSTVDGLATASSLLPTGVRLLLPSSAPYPRVHTQRLQSGAGSLECRLILTKLAIRTYQSDAFSPLRPLRSRFERWICCRFP